ncbi:MAG: PepSY domain-containing protein [Cyanobacteriota bacterium]|nr:PepSY domain-containing protein [Cyanobacteriota bacterium]
MNLRTLRQFHRQLAPIIMLPFLITAITGVAYRLGKSWFGLSRDQVHFLMVIHEGEYLGKQLEPIYVLLNGLGLLFMLATGIVIWGNSLSKSNWFRSLFSRPKQEASE